ncbi:MAG: hypothetical protein JO250_10305 [Armatimonadetes bacterium]|nr:hypothetical protein [Armatimonadota bacterium]
MPFNTPQNDTWPPPPTLPSPDKEKAVRPRLLPAIPLRHDWLVEMNDNEIVFRRPLAQRVLGLSCCLFAVLSLCYLQFYPHLNSYSQWLFQRIMDWFLPVTIIVTALPQVGPWDLTLDLRERTYRFRFGFFLRPKVVTGPFTDIARLCLAGGPQAVGAAKPYVVRLEWDLPKPPPRPILGEFGKKPSGGVAAEALMREVAAKIGVPYIYPER